jgi:hypothetical protein
VQIKLWDKNTAQERLFKYRGLFRKGNGSQPPVSNIKISSVPAGEERAGQLQKSTISPAIFIFFSLLFISMKGMNVLGRVVKTERSHRPCFNSSKSVHH